MVDLHTHILPGIDDGARDLDESLDMCRMAADDAITAIVATPHVGNGTYGNNREKVLTAVAELRAHLERAAIRLRIMMGSDAPISQNLHSLVVNGDIITINDNGRYVLIEFPRDVVPPNWPDWLFQIRLKGITPILTHPERHRGIQANLSLVADWVRAGGLVQITAMSVTGEFGTEAQKCSAYLLRSHLVHAIASDAHTRNGRPPVLSRAVAVASRLVGFPYVYQLVKEFPQAIVEGRSFDVPEPVPIKKSRLFAVLGKTLTAFST